MTEPEQQDVFPVIRAETSRRFARHLLALPRQGLLPTRQAFDPSACPSLLSMLLLRDVAADGTARYRLVGTGIRDLFGSELTGEDPRIIMPESNRARYVEVSRLMFDQPCGICALLHMRTTGGRDLLIENVSFPFAPQADGRRQTLGHFAVLGTDDRSYADSATISHAGEIDFLDIGAGLPAEAERLRNLA